MMKKITSIVSTLALLGGCLAVNSVKASDKSYDEELKKSATTSKQDYNGEFEIPVIGEIQQHGITVFQWPNNEGKEQDFFRINQRVNEEPRIGDVTVSIGLGKDNLWYMNIGIADSQLIRKKGELNPSSRFLIGDGTWGSKFPPLDIEFFWKRQVVNISTLPTYIDFNFSNVSWEKNKIDDKTSTTTSFSGQNLEVDPHGIDLSKLNLTSKSDRYDEEKIDDKKR